MPTKDLAKLLDISAKTQQNVKTKLTIDALGDDVFADIVFKVKEPNVKLKYEKLRL
jgi:hypothetical protein